MLEGLSFGRAEGDEGAFAIRVGDEPREGRLWREGRDGANGGDARTPWGRRRVSRQASIRGKRVCTPAYFSIGASA